MATQPTANFRDESLPPAYNEIYRDLPPPYGAVNGNSSAGLSSNAGEFLFCQDFFPDSRTTKFSDLVHKANAWLAVSPCYRVVSCETVCSLQTPHVSQPSSISHYSSNHDKHYRKFLRCWVTKLFQPSYSPQLIGTFIKVPKKKNHGQLSISAGRINMSIEWNCNPVSPYTQLESCLDELNEQLKTEPLRGSIISIETVQQNVRTGFNFDLLDPLKTISSIPKFDPEEMSWIESGFLNANVSFSYLRIFFSVGQEPVLFIGWKDFVPMVIENKVNPYRPKVEPYSSLFSMASAWAAETPDLKITNIQTVEVDIQPELRRIHKEILSPYFRPDRTLVKTLRVYYVKAETPLIRPPCFLTQKTFTPYQLSQSRYEDPQRLLQRISHWSSFNCSSPYPAEFLCAETIQTPITSGKLINCEKLDHEETTGDSRHSAVTYRFYFNGVYSEPPEYMAPRPPVVYQTPVSQCCAIL